MKIFLKKVLWFLLLVMLFLFIGEMLVRSMQTSYRYKAERLRETGYKYNTLILGTSHSYYGLIPQILGDSVFNLANLSQTPEYDFELLKEFHPFLPNLKRVIIPISYFTFRDPELEELHRSFCVHYKVGMGLKLHSNFSLYNLCISDFRFYSGKLRSLFLEEDLNECDSLGFGLGFDLEHRDERWRSMILERVEELTWEPSQRAERVKEVINELIRYCQRQSIEVVFLTTPVCKEFRDNMDKGQYQEMRECIKVLRAQPGVSYFDFLSFGTFEDEDFHDADHLSDKGAVKLSHLLRDSIGQPQR